jgi:hypothetical protein
LWEAAAGGVVERTESLPAQPVVRVCVVSFRDYLES